jgi:hypothetical protein
MSGRGLVRRALGPVVWLVVACAVPSLLVGPQALAQQGGRGTGIVGPQGDGPMATACNNHGNLHFDRCFCDPGWSGSDCGVPASPISCGQHGLSMGDRCKCDAGWKGRQCTVAITPTPPKCVHGKPDHAKCLCDEGWTGELCRDHS